MPRILIVDDVPANIAILGELLRTEYELAVATDGRKALQLAREQHPDLVLLDVMMPGMDGYTVCATLKRQPETADLPIIFVTARTETEDIVRGFEAGAVDYLTKPFRPPEVLQRVRVHLELKRTRDTLQATVNQLTQALAQVTLLSGLLPICAHCKKIRNDGGYWERVESYIEEHSSAVFSHGICPDCVRQHYPEIADEMLDGRAGVLPGS